MIKFLDILKESDDNIFIPRRTKKEKDKKLLFRTYRKIRDYIKNGSQGNLYLNGSPIEVLPKNLTEVNGDLVLNECVNLKSLPNNLTVNSDLVLMECKNLKSLPSGLKVKGDLDLRDTNITELPPDLEVGSSIFLLRTPIEKLPDNFTVNGRLDLDSSKNITSLPSGLNVKGDLDLRNTNITELPPDLNVGHDLILYGTPLSRNYSRDEIRKMVPKVKEIWA